MFQQYWWMMRFITGLEESLIKPDNKSIAGNEFVFLCSPIKLYSRKRDLCSKHGTVIVKSGNPIILLMFNFNMLWSIIQLIRKLIGTRPLHVLTAFIILAEFQLNGYIHFCSDFLILRDVISWGWNCSCVNLIKLHSALNPY